jgi:hypothetical protein
LPLHCHICSWVPLVVEASVSSRHMFVLVPDSSLKIWFCADVVHLWFDPPLQVKRSTLVPFVLPCW